MRGAPGIGHRRPGGQAGAFQTLDHISDHGGLAAMETGGAGCIDDEPVRRVRGDDRRIAPQREAIERGTVRLRLGLPHDQVPDQCLRLAGGHADAQASALRGQIGSQNDAALSIAPN